MLHRGRDGLQHKHRHDWNGVLRPMKKQLARGNKQKEIINKWAEEQAFHSNAYVVPPNTNIK